MEKLIELDLMTLEDRRGYIDLVETYKIVYGITCRDPTAFFTFTGSRSGRTTRLTEYPRNIIPKRSNLDIHKYFFTQRVASKWNDLLAVIKDSRSIEIFKSALKNHIMSSYSGHV